MYDSGKGVAEDAVEAVRWYRLAAEQGHAGAQFFLGQMYNSGKGVAEDAVEAVRWYRLAAEQGLAAAQGNLGLMYDSGKGVAEDAVEAVRWYRLAAEQGHAGAQFLLGRMYDNGEGVPEDDVEAYAWMSVVAAQGNAVAQKYRKRCRSTAEPEANGEGAEARPRVLAILRRPFPISYRMNRIFLVVRSMTKKIIELSRGVVAAPTMGKVTAESESISSTCRRRRLPIDGTSIQDPCRRSGPIATPSSHRRDSSGCRERWRRSAPLGPGRRTRQFSCRLRRVITGVGRPAHALTHESATRGREFAAACRARTAGTR